MIYLLNLLWNDFLSLGNFIVSVDCFLLFMHIARRPIWINLPAGVYIFVYADAPGNTGMHNYFNTPQEFFWRSKYAPKARK